MSGQFFHGITKDSFSQALRPTSDGFLTLDFMRFIASLAIMLLHYQKEFTIVPLKAAVSGVLSHADLFVDLFFVISGFIIAMVYLNKVTDKKSYQTFLLRRIARLWPLHIALLLAYLAIWGATTAAGIPLRNPEKYDASCILPHIFLLHAFGTCPGVAFNYVSWSISAEMGMYVLTPILFIFARRHIQLPLILSISISVLVASVLYWGTEARAAYTGWTVSYGALRALPAFLLGIYLFQVRERLGWIPKPQLLCWLSMAIFFILSFFYRELSSYVFLLVIYSVVICAVAADMRKDVCGFVRKFAGLGQLTYGSYMIHPLMQTILFAFVAQKIFGVQGWVGDVVMLALIPITFVLSVFSLVLFENPMRRWMSNIPLLNHRIK